MGEIGDALIRRIARRFQLPVTTGISGSAAEAGLATGHRRLSSRTSRQVPATPDAQFSEHVRANGSAELLPDSVKPGRHIGGGHAELSGDLVTRHTRDRKVKDQPLLPLAEAGIRHVALLVKCGVVRTPIAASVGDLHAWRVSEWRHRSSASRSASTAARDDRNGESPAAER
ncbi:hypothetical protein [Saccharopolyspora shandongensis]|uniref:hypothetical protein n=1 Tax=Saccharopolyspora shandongensis TaxID=418495 RepID=UPI0033CB51A8